MSRLAQYNGDSFRSVPLTTSLGMQEVIQITGQSGVKRIIERVYQGLGSVLREGPPCPPNDRGLGCLIQLTELIQYMRQ